MPHPPALEQLLAQVRRAEIQIPSAPPAKLAEHALTLADQGQLLTKRWLDERRWEWAREAGGAVRRAVHVAEWCAERLVRSPELRPPLGLDLSRHADGISRLFMARFGTRCRKAGLDPTDVLQDLYASILRRNAGANPYDPALSSWSTWVFHVARSVVSNAEARAKNRTNQTFWAVGREEDASAVRDPFRVDHELNFDVFDPDCDPRIR